MRPKHWVKNLFVILPVVFSFSFLDPVKVGQSLAAFALFSLAASGVYAVNDIMDAEDDRRHPQKRKTRPIASGAVSKSAAAILAIFLFGIAFFGGYKLSPVFFWVLVVYVFHNFLYTLWLKQIALLDIISVAFGLVLRVIAGVFAIGVSLSPWILGTTFFLGLVIISIKRLREIAVAGTDGSRSVLKFYTPAFLNEIIFMSMMVALSLFPLYSFLKVKSVTFLLTILPVTYGLFRFRWLTTEGRLTTDNPVDIIFRDRPLLFAVLAMGLMMTGIFALHATPYAYLTFPFAE